MNEKCNFHILQLISRNQTKPIKINAISNKDVYFFKISLRAKTLYLLFVNVIIQKPDETFFFRELNSIMVLPEIHFKRQTLALVFLCPLHSFVGLFVLIFLS